MATTLHYLHHHFMACALAACAVVGLKPPSGGGGNINRWSRGKDDHDRFPSPFIVLLPVGLGGIPLALSRRQQQERSPALGTVPVDTYGADFTGHWKLEASENFDEYLTSMNVSATHRRFATRATVEQRITRKIDGEVTGYEVCVLNRLGIKCENFIIGKEPIASSDARGDPIIKYIDWEDKAKRILRTRVDSSVGTLTDKRFLKSADKMTMELISPSEVRAYRHFTRIKQQPPDDHDSDAARSTTTASSSSSSSSATTTRRVPLPAFLFRR